MLRRTRASLVTAAVAVVSLVAGAAPVAAKGGGTTPSPEAVRAATARLTAAMAGAGPAALTRQSTTDPSGDVDDPRADITNVSANYTAHELVLQARMPGGTNPATDPLWQSSFGFTELAFAIDIGEPSYPEFVAIMAGAPRGRIVAALSRDLYDFPPGDYGEPPCDGVRGSYRAHVYTIRVPADCMLNPTEVHVTAGMIIYDRANLPFPVQTEPIVDVAPDHGSLAVRGVPGGYAMFSDAGSTFAFGSFPFSGSIGDVGLQMPVVDAAAARNGRGYLMLGADGGVFRFGKAPFAGSAAGALEPGDTAAAIALTPTAKGYWVVSSRGAVFAFGDARNVGNALPYTANTGVVDLVPTPSGNGYWMVTRNGAVFAFGDAHFYGSAFTLPLRQPIVSLAPTPSGQGYWLIAADGGVFSYGDARFLGSTGGITLTEPITDIAVTSTGTGYTLFAEDGGVFRFGDARWYGSAAQFFGRGRIVAAAAF
jgi:hypothetical protein